jgi:hypothetical protein
MTYRKAALAAIALAAVLFAVPVAFGKKPPTTGAGCKPMVSVILKGTLTSDPEFVGGGTFTLNTTKANKHGKNLIGAPDETVTVDANTKIRRQGAKLVAALESGDRAVVALRVCKGDLPLDAGEVTAVAAKRVTAQMQATP